MKETTEGDFKRAVTNTADRKKIGYINAVYVGRIHRKKKVHEIISRLASEKYPFQISLTMQVTVMMIIILENYITVPILKM